MEKTEKMELGPNQNIIIERLKDILSDDDFLAQVYNDIIYQHLFKDRKRYTSDLIKKFNLNVNLNTLLQCAYNLTNDNLENNNNNIVIYNFKKQLIIDDDKLMDVISFNLLQEIINMFSEGTQDCQFISDIVNNLSDIYLKNKFMTYFDDAIVNKQWLSYNFILNKMQLNIVKLQKSIQCLGDVTDSELTSIKDEQRWLDWITFVDKNEIDE